MKHGRARAASLLPAAGLLLAVACAGVTNTSPARAQAGITDLPGALDMDVLSDPFPFDPRRSLRDYLKVMLPSQWWANEPEMSLGNLTALVHVSDVWEGNPVSAMMRLCPPRESNLWRHVDEIRLIPFYRDVRRAAVTCRR